MLCLGVGIWLFSATGHHWEPHTALVDSTGNWKHSLERHWNNQCHSILSKCFQGSQTFVKGGSRRTLETLEPRRQWTTSFLHLNQGSVLLWDPATLLCRHQPMALLKLLKTGSTETCVHISTDQVLNYHFSTMVLLNVGGWVSKCWNLNSRLLKSRRKNHLSEGKKAIALKSTPSAQKEEKKIRKLALSFCIRWKVSFRE